MASIRKRGNSYLIWENDLNDHSLFIASQIMQSSLEI